MIPRLDVAIERRRQARSVWRAALCGQHAAPEPVTERFEALYRYCRRGPTFAPRKRCPTSYAPHIASLVWEHIGFSGGYVWPSEPLKQKVSAPWKLGSAFLDAAYRTI
jgi:hypothetical protein